MIWMVLLVKYIRERRQGCVVPLSFLKKTNISSNFTK